MINFKKIHHIAIICSNYKKSKRFYTAVLGLEILKEVYRQERKSFKLDLALNGEYIIELFSFPEPPPRKSYPEAAGLRHLSFLVDNFEETIDELTNKGIPCEPIRVDKLTSQRFTFIFDPDDLPIEIYEA